jgi:hypothetical protein
MVLKKSGPTGPYVMKTDTGDQMFGLPSGGNPIGFVWSPSGASVATHHHFYLELWDFTSP